jgi:uncharacterized protein (DUF983 family)
VNQELTTIGLPKLLSNAMLRRTLHQMAKGTKFMCPTCQTTFLHMSGVLQHAESDRCDEDLGQGRPLWKFLRFVQSRF